VAVLDAEWMQPSKELLSWHGESVCGDRDVGAVRYGVMWSGEVRVRPTLRGRH